MTQEQAVNRKARVGTVVSDVNDQTVVVEIERASRHRIYRKVIRQTKKYHVHDPNNEATRGDLVRIEECRPISKLKRWRLVEVLTERAVAEVAPEEIGQEIVEEVQRSATNAAADEAEAADEAPAATITEDAPAAEAPATEPAAEATESEPVADEAPAESGDADEQKAE
jgi:small subunit ribosomal protein S17